MSERRAPIDAGLGLGAVAVTVSYFPPIFAGFDSRFPIPYSRFDYVDLSLQDR